MIENPASNEQRPSTSKGAAPDLGEFATGDFSDQSVQQLFQQLEEKDSF